MFALLLVMIGGALGAGARHLVGKWTLHALGPGYPWGILTVNLVGGFVMGLLAGFLMRQSVSHENFRLVVGVGILGGLTTFSPFSLDVAPMIERGEDRKRVVSGKSVSVRVDHGGRRRLTK